MNSQRHDKKVNYCNLIRFGFIMSDQKYHGLFTFCWQLNIMFPVDILLQHEHVINL
jgi:hypothetical protein